MFRVLIVTLGYGIIILEPESSNNFFEALFIFSGGLVYDYASLAYNAVEMKANNINQYRYQVFVSIIGGIISIIFFALAIIGLFGFVELKISDSEILLLTTNKLMLGGGLELNLRFFLITLAGLPIVAFLELFNKHERFFATQQTSTTVAH